MMRTSLGSFTQDGLNYKYSICCFEDYNSYMIEQLCKKAFRKSNAQ
jgi:hypothetical protein